MCVVLRGIGLRSMQFNNPTQQKMKTKNMKTLNLRTSIGRSFLQLAFLLIPLVLACFALLPRAQAVSPTPDGGYLGANTAEGGPGALFSLTTGSDNTAVGSQALFSLTAGVQNTAVGGSSAL
jgi:hypothetical protein